jgi:hypothetical protein
MNRCGRWYFLKQLAHYICKWSVSGPIKARRIAPPVILLSGFQIFFQIFAAAPPF